jgi:hypothetical protein
MKSKTDTEETTRFQKPPIGVMPRKLHAENRMLDILLAITRYIKVGRQFPGEWIDELNDLNRKEY